MEQKRCTLRFDSVNSQLSIDGIDSNSFVISYSGDIDLTPIVKLLSQKIEEESQIELVYHSEGQSQTEKEKILFETLTKVFESYNRSFSEITDSPTLANSGDTLSDSDDLPF